MIDRPGLSYGLFHLHAQPIKLYGTLTARVEFKGLNLDIGHLRSIRWSKANDSTAWIAYNRLRGQQASALEHATPEAFWIDRTQCRYPDENGQMQNPTLPDCPQAVSAVKALALAARQGQKVFTITSKNAATVLPQLSVSRSVAAEIKNALATGKEVTVHEKAINAYGFSGVGYIIVDPETGSGAYLIEGGGNGGDLVIPGVLTMIISVMAFIGAGIAGTLTAPFVAGLLIYHIILGFFIAGLLLILAGIAEGIGDTTSCNFILGFAMTLITGFLLAAVPITFGLIIVAAALTTVIGISLKDACAGR
ncbi:MAG: hypothetical protein P9G45_12145 [Candidatus Contendobacter sp.]|nr:hypothetical protein [Candidatus Contendobacter sp.]